MILVNYYDETFLQQIEFVLEEELYNASDANYIFVIMSFDKKYDDIYEALKLAGKLVTNRRLIIERVSDPLGDFVITERIEQSIKQAELIICDLSEKSLNVYYELGFARALNKKIIVTAKEGTKLPFDVGHNKTNFYKNTIELQKKVFDELCFHYQKKCWIFLIDFQWCIFKFQGYLLYVVSCKCISVMSEILKCTLEYNNR